MYLCELDFWISCCLMRHFLNHMDSAAGPGTLRRVTRRVVHCITLMNCFLVSRPFSVRFWRKDDDDDDNDNNNTHL